MLLFKTYTATATSKQPIENREQVRRSNFNYIVSNLYYIVSNLYYIVSNLYYIVSNLYYIVIIFLLYY